LKEGEDDGIPVPDDGDVFSGYPEDQPGLELFNDRIAAIEAIKNIGGSYFQKQDFISAAKKYEKVLIHFIFLNLNVIFLYSPHSLRQFVTQLKLEQVKKKMLNCNLSEPFAIQTCKINLSQLKFISLAAI
jgi:hypothetical protein